MKSYEELIKEIDLEIVKQRAREIVVNKLIKNIKETNCLDSTSYHRSYY
jgi:hypothetical protein